MGPLICPAVTNGLYGSSPLGPAGEACWATSAGGPGQGGLVCGLAWVGAAPQAVSEPPAPFAGQAVSEPPAPDAPQEGSAGEEGAGVDHAGVAGAGADGADTEAGAGHDAVSP
ncbi:hypothetical protein Psi02_61890 [Planotetraspora silvatica]|uniref:Uncharacterized protein n=1 Tax=Planotetraspora silvatica TaxID=234614 RepID=A0A8J3US59_9ACTN|nr:hypothetical protein Psi02_61890 [Planotetraspora silvatica]